MSVDQLPIRKKIALNLYRKFRHNETKIHQLNYILWECTLRCNLNCRHCGSDCKQDTAVEDMPLNDFLKALDEVRPIIDPNKTMIVLTGGEAMLRKDINEIGEALYNRGFPWGVVSNGMAWNPEKLKELLNAGMRSATISLDGLEASHNWLRGHKSGYQKALNAIKLLASLETFRYDVVTCVNQKNISELEELKSLLINTGVKEWRIFTIFPIGRAKDDALLKLAPKQFKTLFDFIKQTRKEGKIKLNYGCEGFLGNYEGDVRNNFFFCRAGINIASVLVDGSISACPNLRENFIQGNIYNDNFADVWQNKYHVYRDRSWTKTGECASCEQFKYCEGNGMHLRNEKTGELLFCHLNHLKAAE